MATQATEEAATTARPDLERLEGRITTAGHDHEELSVVAPATAEPIGSIPQCERSDVELAVRRAREAQPAWAGQPVGERRDVLLRLHDLVLDRRDELLDLMQLESGKARRDGFEEVMDVAVTARHYAHRAAGYLASERRRGALPLLTQTTVHHHPLGVVGLIAPWNYPLVLAVSDAIPALLAGNTVVLKPAEDTPYTALAVARLLDEAGLLEGCFEVVTGHGAPIGEPLAAGADFLGFTGSTATGRTVATLAAEHLIPYSLELGGKNPMLVLADADLDRAVEGAIQGCFTNAGQLCISFERLYVQEPVYEAFLERFVAATADLELGTGPSFDVDVGSLVSADQLEKVRAHVDDARERGATVHVGGEHRPDVGPFVYAPTVLTDVPGDALAACEETFGPVARVEPFETVDEAVARANDSDYGLNAAVWTGDADRGRAVARRLECGTVNVNEAYAAAWASVDAPMGGMKRSGVGRRHGPEGFYKYTESQTVAVQRLQPVLSPPGGMSYESFADRMTTVLRVMARIPGLR